jgi:hypothetical protein
VTSSPKLPLLVSYAFLRDMPELCAELTARPDVELLLDSGEFTAKNAGYEIVLTDYLSFLGKYGRGLFGYMALDKIQDPVQTAANLRVMLREGFKPIPIHVFGDGAARMDELFEVSEWVALGGLRRPHRGSAPVSYVSQKMQWARGRNVHWLGYVRLGAIKAFRPFSCDCSSFSSGVRYGNVQAYAGQGRWLNFQLREVLETRAHLRPEVRQILARYDVPVEHFLDERFWRNAKGSGVGDGEAVVVKLPFRSWVSYVMEVRRLLGTRVFIASLPVSLKNLFEAFEWWKVKHGQGTDDAAGARDGLRDDAVRGVPPVAGRARRRGVPARTPPARVPRARRA